MDGSIENSRRQFTSWTTKGQKSNRTSSASFLERHRVASSKQCVAHTTLSSLEPPRIGLPMKTLCLSLATSLNQNPPPPSVAQILLERSKIQWEAHYPQQELRFDEASCSSLGTYYFRDSSLVLEPDGAGQIQLSTLDLMDGRKIELPPAPPLVSTQAEPTSHAWIWWSLAALTAGFVAYECLKPNSQSTLPAATRYPTRSPTRFQLKF